MNRDQLRKEISLVGLSTRSSTSKVLHDALIAEYHKMNEIVDPVDAQVVDESLQRGARLEETKESIDDVDIENDACLGCAFMHYFMLEELPNAIKTSKRVESVDNALKFIRDTHEKFMLYQGHVVRAWNQSRRLEAMEQTLFDACLEEKNTKARLLWHIVDFKMKWEAMHQRETMTQGFGKRGTSWHGNYVFYYVWDEKTAQPSKHIAKLDQIIDGTNEQTGTNVFALVEASQVYLKEAFPGADIQYLQSDNAQCYHLKELVLGIPQLNAKMKRIDGPIIRNFVHTETQDGKNLLDAHFAHATALIKRYLKRVRQNQQNRVTSPSELADALSALGGLQNCGVQLVSFDDDVALKLKALSASTHRVAKKMKEFFTRCNEINYFPSFDSEDGKVFFMNAKAYSNIGSGACFHVDVEQGMVDIVDAPCTDDQSADQTNKDKEEVTSTRRLGRVNVVEADEQSATSTFVEYVGLALDTLADLSICGDIEEVSNSVEDDETGQDEATGESSFDDKSDDDDEPDDLSVDAVMTALEICETGEDPEQDREDEVYLLDAVDDESEGEKALKSTNGMSLYWAPSMLSGIKVEKVMQLGTVLSTKANSTRRKQRENLKQQGRVQMDVVSQGLRLMHSEGYGRLKIRRGDDEAQAVEFLRCVGYVTPPEFKMKPGWARRKPPGKMYGAKYIMEYRGDIFAMFMRGVDDSSLKKGPSMMMEVLHFKYPNVYTLPNFVEIQTLIGNLFDKHKKGRLVGLGDVRIDEEDDNDEDDDTLEDDDNNADRVCLERVAAIEAEVTAIVDRYGGAIQPKWVLFKMGTLDKAETEVASKVITRTRNTLRKQQKRSLIG